MRDSLELEKVTNSKWKTGNLEGRRGIRARYVHCRLQFHATSAAFIPQTHAEVDIQWSIVSAAPVSASEGISL